MTATANLYVPVRIVNALNLSLEFVVITLFHKTILASVGLRLLDRLPGLRLWTSPADPLQYGSPLKLRTKLSLSCLSRNSCYSMSAVGLL